MKQLILILALLGILLVSGCTEQRYIIDSDEEYVLIGFIYIENETCFRQCNVCHSEELNMTYACDCSEIECDS